MHQIVFARDSESGLRQWAQLHLGFGNQFIIDKFTILSPGEPNEEE